MLPCCGLHWEAVTPNPAMAWKSDPNWSGQVDYLSEATGFPIQYTLQPNRGEGPSFPTHRTSMQRPGSKEGHVPSVK